MKPHPNGFRDICLALLLLFATGAAPPAGAGAPSGSSQERFQEANRLYERALRARGDERDTLLRSSAAIFETLVEKDGIRNGYLYYDLGNVYQLLGDVGRAILNYRRAERLVPGYAPLRANLEAALALRRDAAGSDAFGEIVRTLSLRRYWLDLPKTAMIFSAAFVALFAWLAVRLFARPPFFRTVLAVLAVTAALSGAAGAALLLEEATDRSGVIVAESAEARKGPGETFESRYTTPLHSGTEFRLESRREGWLQVRLGNGDDVWIRDADAELVAGP